MTRDLKAEVEEGFDEVIEKVKQEISGYR